VKARLALEAILHPLVYQRLSEKVAHLSDPYCIFAIPLLIETGRQAFVDRILVVDCPIEQQLARVRQRDGLDHAAIGLVINAQASREAKIAAADDLIDNSGSIERLRRQVEKLHHAYLALAFNQS
jgi:dephospho-CoA kinase